jgi:hypothetical protein
MAAAVPFDRGVLVASSHRVAKAPWGLVTGSGVVTGFERPYGGFAGPRRPGLEGIHIELGYLWGDTSEKPSWLFSYEDVEADGSIGLYRDFGDGPIAIGWGWVLLSGHVGQGATSDEKEVLRDGELRLQWDLDRGSDLDMRLEALTRAFEWFGSMWEWLGGDFEVGIHEPGHQYSVDRVGFRL